MKRLLVLALALMLAIPWLPKTAAAQDGAVTIEINCLASPQTVRIVNGTAATVTINTIAGIRASEIGMSAFQLGDTLPPGAFVIYAFGPNRGAQAGNEFLSQQPLFTTSVAHPEADGVIVGTSAGQGQVTCLQASGAVSTTPLLGGSRVDIHIDCLAQPQTVTITNNTPSPITIQRLTSQSYAQRALAPFFPNQSLPPGAAALYAFGVEGGAHRPERFLSQRPIFSTAPDSQNEDGVLMMTNVGNAMVSCAQGDGAIYTTGTPTGPSNYLFTVEISCTRAPQTVRVTNVSNQTLTVTGIQGILNTRTTGQFPYEPNTTLRPGGFVIYAFGRNPGASAGLQFLSSSPLFASSGPQFNQDGVIVDTNVGSATVMCNAPA